MERTVCIWVPHLELQVRLLAEPELASVPVLLADIGSLGGRVLDASGQARALGVQPRMLTTRARALCPEGVVIPPDPALVRKTREHILQILYRFGPLVGRDDLEAFFVDLTDLNRLHPDESALADTIARTLLGELSLVVKVAIADSPVSAWIVARAAAEDAAIGRSQTAAIRHVQTQVVPRGHDPEHLARLPIEALPMPEQLVRLCRALGLSLVGELQKLPRGSLVQRFGKQGALLEARARASAHHIARRDLFQIEIPEQIPQSVLHLDQPTDAFDVLVFLHKNTLSQLLRQVAATRRVVATIELTLKLADSDRTSIKHLVRPARPTLDEKLLLDLIILWLSTAPASDLIDSIVMRALEVARATARQLRLFERHEDLADDAMKQALSQLVATFGEHAIRYPYLADSHRPEQRIGWSHTPRTTNRQADDNAPTHQHDSTADENRPLLPAVLELLDPPEPIVLEDLAIARRWGPHTVEGDWWASGYRRSYFLLGLETNELLWVYRDAGGWYLHAWVD